jgi:hypothetical protein
LDWPDWLESCWRWVGRGPGEVASNICQRLSDIPDAMMLCVLPAQTDRAARLPVISREMPVMGGRAQMLPLNYDGVILCVKQCLDAHRQACLSSSKSKF